ncbi:MAG: hypothetical protein IT436_07100 [Phycisphaerales bacterium]|nr:hypothetical protein [Phycisphaerales bacterium]
MFAKLVVVVLTIGACACTLLSLRQARLQAAHELTRAQLRVRECDDRLWAMRADIARRVMPDQVRHMANALGSFRPMLPLPGDAERRSEYARLHMSPADPVPLPQTRPAANPGVELRTVSDNRRAGPAAPIKPGVTPKPAIAKAPAKMTGPDAKPKAGAKPDSKPDKKPDAAADAKRAKPRPDRKQATADRPERAP